MTDTPKESDATLAALLILIIQEHVQRHGPLSDAVGDALKSALGALKQEEPREKKYQEAEPAPVYMVLKRRDGFVRRYPCPKSGPPPMWCVPNSSRQSVSFGDSDLTAISMSQTIFRRTRWISPTEIEYLED